MELLAEMGGKGVEVYDCDKAVAELQAGGRISRDLVTAFGPEALDARGAVNKDMLRDIVRHDPEGRKRLEDIIHPKLATACREAQAAAREREDVHTFIVDIPLYFESKEDFAADRVCLVAVSEQTQLARLTARDGCTGEEGRAMLRAQLPMQQKVDGADVVFWNEGSRELLQEQVRYFFDAELAVDAKVMQARAVVVDVNALRAMPLNDLQQKARSSGLGNIESLNRSGLVLEMVRAALREGNQVFVSGLLEYGRDKVYMLRDAARSFRPAEDDVAIPPELVRQFDLRPGNKLTVRLRADGNARALRAQELVAVEGTPIAEFRQFTHFDRLTPLIPKDRLILENADIKSPAMRLLDLITPLGMGQRALVVAPPRGGKTVLLKTIARSLQANYPQAEMLVLLLDERPEEVTDFEETVSAPVYASTFDEPSARHAQLSDLVLERAHRLVEQGRDVIILLDSLTRLARGYNANQAGGRVMSGGLGSNALEKPRKFFGAARNVEEGGSLTIIATCLVDTESRMDEIIFEEFKGTGNMEIRLDREFSERRIYPAISIPQSGTRNDDRLYHPDELVRVLQLRRALAAEPPMDALKLLLKNILRTQNNAELLLRGLTVFK